MKFSENLLRMHSKLRELSGFVFLPLDPQPLPPLLQVWGLCCQGERWRPCFQPPCLQAELCTNSSSMDGNVCGGLVTVKVCCSDFQHNPGGPAAHFQSRGRSHGRECSVSAELEAQGGTNQNRDPGCQFRPKSGEPSIY